jgi:hypothetical protein
MVLGRHIGSHLTREWAPWPWRQHNHRHPLVLPGERTCRLPPEMSYSTGLCKYTNVSVHKYEALILSNTTMLMGKYDKLGQRNIVLIFEEIYVKVIRTSIAAEGIGGGHNGEDSQVIRT